MAEHETRGKMNDYRTPAYVFEGLGPFDCDPCYPDLNSQNYYVPLTDTAQKIRPNVNGLRTEWEGYVWMNPPFGKRNGIVPWLEKFVAHRNGIALVPNRTGSGWFREFTSLVDCISLVSPKVKFIRPTGEVAGAPGFGSILLGIGQRAVEELQAYKGGLFFVNPGMCDVSHFNHKDVVEVEVAERV